ncbi:hypothetical protein [Dickeya chrysanthemi]|uniref:hypothetical protein n=1 Tax=Dickeya chrysanthemi TaxID=556 RepID=UPI0012E002A3|nr:hypothetical protein [Dickeya chrysanthemi]
MRYLLLMQAQNCTSLVQMAVDDALRWGKATNNAITDGAMEPAVHPRETPGTQWRAAGQPGS